MKERASLRNLAAVAVLLMAAGCGGGKSTPSTAANVQAVTVDPGPANNVNLLFTTVTICAPGSTSTCQTIDHVQVDTGSTGLRIVSSVLSLSLPQQTDANNNPIVECGQFADGVTWGSVKVADVRISGELAGSVPIQVIADPVFSAVPASCSGIGPVENSVQALGANGLLGIGNFQQDCGAACALSIIPGTYYICPSTGCQESLASLTQQLQNPVGMFAQDNNGVSISLPSVSAAGASSVSGTMTFGIATQGNNGLGNAQVFPLDPTTGAFTTSLPSSSVSSYSNSFIDSGSNALFFADANIAVCTSSTDSGFDCPPSALNLSATNQGINGPASTINFQVANAGSLLASNVAFGNLAGTNSDASSFDWGLSFFFGRKVFVAIEGQSTPAGLGPYIAY
jgi:hypothetical protein